MNFEDTIDFQDTIHLGEEVQMPIHEAACTPLYDDGSYSILWMCLEFLILQELYGWRNTSFNNLKYENGQIMGENKC